MQHREPSLVLCDDLEGWDGGSGGRLGKEGTFVVVWQKPIQHCIKLYIYIYIHIYIYICACMLSCVQLIATLWTVAC